MSVKLKPRTVDAHSTKGLESTPCILESGRTLRDIFRVIESTEYALVVGRKDGVSAGQYIGSPKLA